MLRRFGALLMVLLLYKDFNLTEGYVYQIWKENKLRACVSDETSVAFARQWDGINTGFKKMDFDGLWKNDSVAPNSHDCNLLIANGCSSWHWSDIQWKHESNLKDFVDPYSMVTDFRWDDLPSYFTEGKFKQRIVVTQNQNFTMHFSILAQDSAQFLVTDDSSLRSGLSAVIDGWGDAHTSLLRYCTHLPDSIEVYPTCTNNQNIKNGKNVFFRGGNWAHVTLAISFVNSSREQELTLGEKISIHIYLRKSHNANYVSFKTNKGGLFKLHRYWALRALQTNSTLDLTYRADSNHSFCLRVVYLATSNFKINTTALTLEITDSTEELKFEKSIQVKELSEWLVVRFNSSEIRLQKNWHLKLIAHSTQIIIGGAKFCKEAFDVIKPNIRGATNCHSLKWEKAKEHDEYSQVLLKLSECDEFEKNCSGYKMCVDESGSDLFCSCFAGYAGAECENRCQGRHYGLNCSSYSSKNCTGDKTDPVNGHCLEGCAEALVFPQCDHECTGADYGTNCSHTSNRTCLNGNYSSIDGQCREGCSEGYISPECLHSKSSILSNCRLVAQRMNSSTFAIGLALNAASETQRCKPMSIEITTNETVLIMNDTLQEIDFQIYVNCSECLDFCNISLQFQNGVTTNLHYACLSEVDKTKIFSLHLMAGLISAACVVALGLVICHLKSKQSKANPADVNNTMELSRMSNASSCRTLSSKNEDDDSLYAFPYDASQVELYLKSALSNDFLKNLFEKFPRGQTQPWDVGTKPENLKKNRYTNLAAYDASRVKLDLLPGDENSDYINANFIDGYGRPRAYIASQGPMANTLDDFWRMVWQEKVRLIVMLTNLVEKGKVQCEKYWPNEEQEKEYGHITVSTLKEEIHADFISRLFLVSCDNICRNVQQLHFTSRPNYGLPLYPQKMASFIEKMRSHNVQHPILVHCSAGVGRTGTVILIDACLQMVRSHGTIDVEHIFAQMRSQRANLVDNLSQFEFVHLVLMESFLNPKFEISTVQFAEEYKYLTAKDRLKLLEKFAQLDVICQTDFKMAGGPAANEPSRCRYPDVIASSSAIVSLFPYGDVTCMNFINAVFVDGYKRERQFIATQVPMENTVWDFWRMVDQFKVGEIVVLNDLHSSYGDFLPTKQRHLDFGEINVVLHEIHENTHLRTLDLRLHARGICRNVSVKRPFLGWMPGQVTPPSLESLIELWKALEFTNDRATVTTICHDGLTASGLFLSIGFLIEKIKLEQKVDVGLAVRTLRKARPAFISSEIQFGLLYEAAKIYLESLDSYDNFK